MSDSINDLEFKKFIDLGNGLRGIAIINYGLAADGPNAGEYVSGASNTTEEYDLGGGDPPAATFIPRVTMF